MYVDLLEDKFARNFSPGKCCANHIFPVEAIFESAHKCTTKKSRRTSNENSFLIHYVHWIWNSWRLVEFCLFTLRGCVIHKKNVPLENLFFRKWILKFNMGCILKHFSKAFFKIILSELLFLIIHKVEWLFYCYEIFSRQFLNLTHSCRADKGNKYVVLRWTQIYSVDVLAMAIWDA